MDKYPNLLTLTLSVGRIINQSFIQHSKNNDNSHAYVNMYPERAGNEVILLI